MTIESRGFVGGAARLAASLFALAVILWSASAQAATRTAASCSRTDVANAISAAADGDTVVVPAGNCTWTSTITLSNKSISILGAGIGSTVISNSAGGPLIRWTVKPTGNTPPGFSRLSGFTFNDSGCGQDGNIVIVGDSPNVRVDHIFFNADNCPGLYMEGYVRGVIDHNTFDMTATPGYALLLRHPSWQNIGDMPSGSGAGGQSWVAPSTIGTAHQIVVEDNTFVAPGGELRYFTDDQSGLRATYRFNNLTNGIFADHGTDTAGRYRSPRHREYYANTGKMSFPSSPTGAIIALRGGSGIIFDNTASGDINGAVADLQYYRYQDNREFVVYGRCSIQQVTSLTRSGTTATATVANHGINSQGSYLTISGANPSGFNGTYLGHFASENSFTFTVSSSLPSQATGNIVTYSPFDGNSETTGYRCLDQIGAGQGNRLITGDGPSYGIIDNPGPSNQALEPVYGWNNLEGGALSALLPREPDVIIENRDYYTQKASFNGTVGVGRGPRSARPSSCTSGVAYWSTDQGANWNTSNGGGADGTLDRCTATNTWTNAWYTPLAYPHPLTSGTGATPPPTPPTPPQAPAAPTNVRIIK